MNNESEKKKKKKGNYFWIILKSRMIPIMKKHELKKA